MTTPDGSFAVKLNMIGFVDDSTTITSGEPTITAGELLQRIQKDAQIWHDLLWISGGNLELEKCGYHCIFYKFDENDQPVMQREIDGNIKLKKANRETVQIKQKNIYQSRKNLGHHKAPSRTYKKQTEAILQVADEIAEAISKSGASRSMAKLFFTTV